MHHTKQLETHLPPAMPAKACRMLIAWQASKANSIWGVWRRSWGSSHPGHRWTEIDRILRSSRVSDGQAPKYLQGI